jgi:hypothetical protein
MYCPYDVFNSDLRLNEVAIGTKAFTSLTLIFAAEGGHHNHLDTLCLSCRSQDIEHVESADLWHHHVTNNKIRTILDRHGQCFFAVARRDNIVSFR